jgi:hypothetical protein
MRGRKRRSAMITSTNVTGWTYYPVYGHPLQGSRYGTYYPQTPTTLFPGLTPTAPPRSEYDRRITEIIPWLINRPPTTISPS